MIVLLQVLEGFAGLAALVLLLAGRAWPEVLAAMGGLYAVHLGELLLEWRDHRERMRGSRYLFLVYLVPGLVMLRRIVEFVAASLIVRLYLLAVIAMLLLTLPITLIDRADILSHRIGRVRDRFDMAVEPLMDALLRGYNAVSLNPHTPGETGMVLAIPMPFRERLL